MYEEKKQQLEKLQNELTERLDNLKKEMSKSHSTDWDEQAIERENDEVIERLREETTDELKQIENALKRIEAGNYGKCAICGEDINPERLAALPYVTTCIACASAN